VLGQIFGSEDVSRTGAVPVTQSAPSGGQPASAGGGLGGLFEGGSQSGQRSGGLASTLDLNGDGNPLDDIMRMAGKLGR
jgi:hypothetical protein